MSLDKTQSLLEHFIKSATDTTSIFHEQKSGNVPAVAHDVDIVTFSSAKQSIDKDLTSLLTSNATAARDLVYSVHYADINGLSRLENSILAHEISEFLGIDDKMN